MSELRTALIALAMGMMVLATPAADARETLGAFGDWAAFRDPGNDTRCYAVTGPNQTRASTQNVRRGQASLSVGFWPGRSGPQLHAATGFGIDPSKPVTLKIGSRSFTLLPEGESAWAENAAADEAIIKALRQGTTAEVTSTSTRGTQITDRYSLKGISAALDAARSACSGKNAG
ncbi:MAG TPA: invasion associated locus B family protein [Pedomonas sp.]|uniref:invasion associated locus B family protein n=1 Tax=Pedomonas sp. TaxID=2976421 RepID=UPI002F3FBB84